MTVEEWCGRSGDPLVGGTLIEGYLVLERLGEGGMGVVYRGFNVSLQQDVAIKILRGWHGPNDRAALRFQREARIAACTRSGSCSTSWRPAACPTKEPPWSS